MFRKKWNLFLLQTATCPVRKVYIFLQKAVEERLQSIYLSDLLDDVDSVLERELESDKNSKSK